MRIDVAELLKRPVGSTVSYPVSETAEGPDGEPCWVEGKVELMRIGRGILMRATFDTSVKCTCSRCLDLFDHPMRLQIVEEILPRVDVNTGLPVPPPDDPVAFTIGADQVLDTSEAVRQHIIMSMPLQPLCSEDCVGLCPTCGHNLNEGPCGCERVEEDPRWRSLREWASGNDSELK